MVLEDYSRNITVFECFFFFLSRKFSLSVAMAKFIQLVEDYSQKHFSKICQNICSNTEINASFHFSHYKYMETLSCHGNESTLATTIKIHFM